MCRSNEAFRNIDYIVVSLLTMGPQIKMFAGPLSACTRPTCTSYLISRNSIQRLTVRQYPDRWPPFLYRDASLPPRPPLTG